MGLTWAKPIKIKNNTLILVKARIPEKDKPGNDEIWALYRSKKNELKADGFSVTKDKYYGKWYATYFHGVGPTSFQKDENGKDLWEMDFRRKVAKWKNIVQNVQSALDNPDGTKFTTPPAKNGAGRGRGRGRGNSADVGMPGVGVTLDEPISGNSMSMDALLAEFDDLDSGDDFN